MFVILAAADGAPSSTVPSANYPPPSSPCTYAPIIGNLFSHDTQSQAAGDAAGVAPAATSAYPPPSWICGPRPERIYAPVIWDNAR
jgi:hypothetical protein